MSHFSVIVIGENVEQQLQPYHEFECTGIDDQYVQDIDETEDRRDEFASDTRSVIKCPNGELVARYDDRFFRDPTEDEKKEIGPISGTGCTKGFSFTSKDWGDGRGYRTKVHFIPEGHEALEVPFDNFRDYLRDYRGIPEVSIDHPLDLSKTHKYAYTRIVNGEVEKVINRTNPNKEWDWWVIGGRWSGFLKLKPGASGELGSPGLMGACADAGPGRADQASKDAIDFEGMRADAANRAAAEWDKAYAARNGETWQTWEHLRDAVHKDDIGAARSAYHDQPALKRVRETFDNPFNSLDRYLMPRGEFVHQARAKATVPYALVQDGKWYAKGQMGWWGASDQKIGEDEWNRKVNALLDSLPDDTLITIVDCHI